MARSEQEFTNEDLIAALREIASRQVPRLQEDADTMRNAATALEDWEQSFDLYNGAIRRGTKLWHDRGGDPDVWPDTGKLVAWILDLVAKAEKANNLLGDGLQEILGTLRAGIAQAVGLTDDQIERIAEIASDAAAMVPSDERVRVYADVWRRELNEIAEKMRK